MNNYQIIVFLAGIVVTVVMLTYAPWVQDHPGIPGPVQQIGPAPVWSHRFDAHPGARIDQVELWTFLLFDWLTSGAIIVFIKGDWISCEFPKVDVRGFPEILEKIIEVNGSPAARARFISPKCFEGKENGCDT